MPPRHVLQGPASPQSASVVHPGLPELLLDEEEELAPEDDEVLAEASASPLDELLLDAPASLPEPLLDDELFELEELEVDELLELEELEVDELLLDELVPDELVLDEEDELLA